MSDESTPEEEQRPPSERETLIDRITKSNTLMEQLISQCRKDLLRLDEIGAPVTRSRNRISKLEEARTDWWVHFDYDVVKGNSSGTKDQRARAERYDLS